HYEPAIADFLRETADAWNEAIDHWTYRTDTALARQQGVTGHYIRIAASGADQEMLELKNQVDGRARFRADDIVSPDALALVRYGLRAPDDPRIVNTVKILDAALKVDLAEGPCWY